MVPSSDATVNQAGLSFVGSLRPSAFTTLGGAQPQSSFSGDRNPGANSIVRVWPPISAALSRTRTRRFAFASVAAAVRPLGPAPMTIASYFIAHELTEGGQRGHAVRSSRAGVS